MKDELQPKSFLFQTPFIETVEICEVIETDDSIEIDKSQIRAENREHILTVYRLDGMPVFRVHVLYNKQIPHEFDIKKDEELGWILEEFRRSSSTVQQIGKIIEQHLYN